MTAMSLACAGVIAQAQPAPVQLGPVQVFGATDATTEGTGSYAAPLATVAGKTATSRLDIPQSVSIVTRQRIEDQNLVTPEDALAQVVGVNVTPWDAASFQIRSRGYFLEPSYDGMPAGGALNATQQFDLAMFDRLEVLRGPSGLFQGSGQPGGTVNFVRKRAPAEFRGSAAASYGSWANRRLEADVGGPLSADGALRARLVTSVQRRNFYYDQAHSRRHFLYGTLDYDIGRHTSLSLYGAIQDDKTSPFTGLPAYTDGTLIDAPRATNPMAPWSRYDTRSRTLGAQAVHRLPGDWSVTVHARHASRDWRVNDGYPATGVNPVTLSANYARRGWDDDSSRNALDLYASGPFGLLGRRHEATIGANVERYRGDTRYGAQSSVPDIPFLRPALVPENSVTPYVRGSGYETRQHGAYGQLRLSVAQPLTLVIGGRLSSYTTRNRSVAPSAQTDWNTGTRENAVFTPYAGLVYRVHPQVSVYASYTDIFMPQSARTLNGDTLAPREGRQFEVGVKAENAKGTLMASAAAFRTRDVNRSFPDLANPGFFLAAGEVEIKGAELEVTGSPLPNLELSAGYAYLTSSYAVDRNNQGAAFALFEPRHALKLYGSYRFAQTPWRVGAGLIANTRILGSGEPGVRESGGFALINAQVGYTVDARTTITLAATNLLDRRYYARVGGINSYNIYGEPRSVTLGVRTRF